MKKNDKKYQPETLKKVLSYIQAYRIYLALSLIFAVVTVASTLYIPVLTGQVIDHVIAPGQVEFPVITELLVRMAVVILLAALAQWEQNLSEKYFAERLIHQASLWIYMPPILVLPRPIRWRERCPMQMQTPLKRQATVHTV